MKRFSGPPWTPSAWPRRSQGSDIGVSTSPKGGSNGPRELARIHRREPVDPAWIPLDEHLAFYHPEDRERVRWHLDEAVAGVGAFARDDYEHRSRIIRPGGECRVVTERGIVERDPTGAIRAISGICLDVTELARSDQHLRETTNLLRIHPGKHRRGPRHGRHG